MKLSAEAKRYFAAAGKKGGQARREMMTPEQRRELAKKAAAARWNKRRNLQEAIDILDSAKCGVIGYSERLSNAARYLQKQREGTQRKK
jgi:hypothetical protein